MVTKSLVLFVLVATCIACFTATEAGDLPPFLTTEELVAAGKTVVVPDLNRYYNQTPQILDDEVKSKNSRNFERGNIWPNQRVPYTLNSNLNAENRIQVALSFEDFHAKTCVRFVPKLTSDKDFVDIVRDDNTCGVANFCRAGGRQEAKFGGGCQDARTMIHELGHTLCMGHEQDRSDRDNYIRFEGCNGGTPSDPSWWTNPSFYDYFSVMHYDGCWQGACMQATQHLPNGHCGNPGRLGVLDVEKINEKYQCKGCLSYRFKAFSKLTAQDNLVVGGHDVNGAPLHICRFYVNGEIVVGKANIAQKSCWVAYANGEVGSRGSQVFEVLTNPENIQLTWKVTSKGQPIPAGSIAGGRRTGTGQYLVIPETYYIGRCKWNTGSGIETTPGKVHGAGGAMFLPWGGAARECMTYEILTCV